MSDTCYRCGWCNTTDTPEPQRRGMVTVLDDHGAAPACGPCVAVYLLSRTSPDPHVSVVLHTPAAVTA